MTNPANTLDNHAQTADRDHHLHPFTSPKGQAEHGSHIITRGEGCYLWDAFGNRFFDAMAGLGCVNIGYGRPELADIAAEAIKTLSYYHAFANTTNPYAAELAEKLSQLLPDGFNRVFFCNSGSEANETNLKIVRSYWHAKGRPERKIVIARTFGYHGSTLATASLTGLKAMHEQFGLPLGDAVHIDAPYWYRQGGEMTPEEYGIAAADALERKIIERGPKNIAAFIAEPIQATAGAIIAPESYWPEVNRICRKYEILLIADEVVTAFGRTGHWFTSPVCGIEPDLITMAKGLSSGYQPIAAAAVSDEIFAVLSKSDGVFQHGFTTSAHPVACAVALKNIALLEQEGLVENTRERIGPYFQSVLRDLLEHPLVGEVRGEGLIAGIELCKDKPSREQYPLEMAVCGQVTNQCLMQGLILRPTGNSLVLCPPLVITQEEIDMVAGVLRTALDRTLHALGG